MAMRPFVPTPLPGLREERQAAGVPYGSSAGPPGMASQSVPQHQAGGQITNDKRDQTFLTVARLYSRLPLGSMYQPTVTPATPITYELGSFQVPAGKKLWCMDYRFNVMKQSGVQAGNMVPAEDGEFLGRMAFDISINGSRRQADIQYELDPRPITLQRQQFVQQGATRTTTADTVLRARQEQYAAASGFGSAALPHINSTYAPRGQRVTIYGEEGDHLVLRFSVFRPLALPIAAITGWFSGYLLQRQVADALDNRLRAI